MSTLDDCKIIQLPTIRNRQGNLTPIHSKIDIAFDIKRIYYLYDVPGGASRGGHAHKELQQVVVSVMGAFDVILDDGKNKKTVHLDRAYYGLSIPKMIWSLPYDETDYYRDYDGYLRALTK
jgi:hypothetical protein